MRSRIWAVSFFVFIFSTVFFAGNAEAQQTCLQKQMSCTSTCDSGSPDYARCVERCNDRLVSCANTTKTDCISTYSACNLGCRGDNILSCLQQCKNRNNVCTTAERAAKNAEKERRRQSRRQPERTFTPPPASNQGSAYQGPSDNSAEFSDALRGLLGEPKQSEGFIGRANTCREHGGKLVNGTCVEDSRSSAANSQDDIRKELGTDLATMKAVSDIGARNALKCAVLQTNSSGFVEVYNHCGKTVQYGYCYSEWVPKRDLKNPFKCDYTGKPSWSAADWVKASSTRPFPIQSDSKSRRVNFGPCMEEVVYNNRTYIYLNSKRTTTGPFNGMGGKYKCMYLKSAGQK